MTGCLLQPLVVCMQARSCANSIVPTCYATKPSDLPRPPQTNVLRNSLKLETDPTGPVTWACEHCAVEIYRQLARYRTYVGNTHMLKTQNMLHFCQLLQSISCSMRCSDGAEAGQHNSSPPLQTDL